MPVHDSYEDSLHLRVFRNRPEPGNRRIHVHPTHELNFLCHGLQGLEVENRNYTMFPGDLLVLPAGMEHCILSDESLPYQRIRLHLPVRFPDLLGFGKKELEEVDRVLFSGRETILRFSSSDAVYVQNLMEHMVEEEENEGPGWELGLQADTILLLLTAMRSLDCAVQPLEPSLIRRRHDMNLVIHFMEEHYAEPITLSGMANIFDVHPSVLSRNFKRVTGTAPMLYLNRIRIAHSKQIMESEPDLLLEEVCQQVGYRSLIYFSRIFKKLNGITPSQYKKSIPDRGDAQDRGERP